MRNKYKDEKKVFEPNEYPLDNGLRLIEASAGTGKTFALAHLVLRLITEKELSLDKILVVTFTNAAASELKIRISKRILNALKGIQFHEKLIPVELEDKVLEKWIKSTAAIEDNGKRYKKLLLENLERIDYSDITTIHGFCLRTLKRDPLVSGVDLGITLDGEGRNAIKEVVHEYWQRQLLKLESDDLYALQCAGLTPQKLEEAMIKIDSDPCLQLEIIPDIDSQKDLRDQFDKWLKVKWINFQLLWKTEGNDLESYLRKMATDWRSNGIKDTKPYSPKPKKDRNKIIEDWIKIWENSDSENYSKPNFNQIRQQALIGNYYHPAILSQLSVKLDKCKTINIEFELQRAIAEIWDNPAEYTWNHALHWCKQSLNAIRKQQGIMSYGNLISALDTRQYNKNNNQGESEKPPFIKELRLRYKVVLVDEFQDTDRLQWNLLKDIFGDSDNHLLIIVGDPKQAIYRFRGGDLNTYLKAKKEVERIDHLVDNYRTGSDLLDGLNQLMEPGLNHSNLIVDKINSKRDNTFLNICKDKYPLQVLTIKESDSSSKSSSKLTIRKADLEDQIPIAVANYLVKLLEIDKFNLKLNDICILVNRHDQAKSISQTLKRFGLYSRRIDHGDILTSEAAEILQTFLNCLANIGNSRYLRLLACSSLIQWDLKKLEDSEYAEDLDLIACRLGKLEKDFTKLGVWGCLAKFIDSRMMADLSARGRLLSDIQQCAEIVQDSIQDRGFNIQQAANWLQHNRQYPIDPIPENQLPQSDVEEDAINVLTIHRSKGQEYPVVICPYLWENPPKPSGPLWRIDKRSYWLIALNKGWGNGKAANEASLKNSIEEAERLAYVALTRAKDLLIILWVQESNQDYNPLKCLLFGASEFSTPVGDLSIANLNARIKKNKFKISLVEANNDEPKKLWTKQEKQKNLTLGATPNRQLDNTWARNSYSSWLSKNEDHYEDPIKNEEGKDTDYIETNDPPFINSKELILSKKENCSLWSNRGPLSNFPKGPFAGDCLHKILEKIDLSKPLEDIESKSIISEELLRAGLSSEYLQSVQDGLNRVFNTPLGSHLGDFCLNQLHKKRMIKELNFDLPISNNKNPIKSKDIARIFKLNESARFSSNYSRRVEKLNFSSTGFLAGAIDLVFSDNEDQNNARWWVVDWKSNWRGDAETTQENSNCGPKHYLYDSMEEQMISHHYPLQAHIYLVAIHRFLKLKLPSYQPSEHLGGYCYVFLRGIPKPDEITLESKNKQVPGFFVEEAPLERILAFDQLLKEGGQ